MTMNCITHFIKNTPSQLAVYNKMEMDLKRSELSNPAKCCSSCINYDDGHGENNLNFCIFTMLWCYDY